jgi:methylphosphotriester-DNA--protein-cysteine methyltransferase
VNALYIIFFGVSLAVISATLFFYLRKRDTRRFLTTMHLSVLDPTVQKGCRYIESNYMNPKLAANDVCRELVTGEAYLNALFVKEIGIDVQDFITQVRVNSVKYLLAANPGQDPGKVFTQSGFADRGTAEKSFTRLCGIDVEEYVRSQPK